MATAAAPDAAPARRFIVPGFAALSLIWGSSFLFIKVGVDDGIPPAFLAWVRVALAAAILLALPPAPGCSAASAAGCAGC